MHIDLDQCLVHFIAFHSKVQYQVFKELSRISRDVLSFLYLFIDGKKYGENMNDEKRKNGKVCIYDIHRV